MVGFGGAGGHWGIGLLGTLEAGSWGVLGLDLGILESTRVGLGDAGSRTAVLGTLEAGIWVLEIEAGIAGKSLGTLRRTLGSHERAGARDDGTQKEEDPVTSPSPGIQDGATRVSQDLAGRKGVELDIVEYYSYWHPDPSTMPEPR